MNTRYYLPEAFYHEFSKLKQAKVDFVYERTTYTKKLKTDGYTMFFNPDGRSDDRVLSLINKVRNDGKKYMLEHSEKMPDSKIHFMDLFNIPKSEDVITKIDITKAYWKQGTMDGVISEETNDFLNKSFNEYTTKKIKGVRLKALGSLATRKEVEIYEKGLAVDWGIIEQPTKPIYMNICRSIDDMMRKCKSEIGGYGCVMYYWDCMFVKKEFAKNVLDYFQSKDFSCTMEDTKLDYMSIGTKGYLTSEVDGKMYLVSSENRNLLKDI